MDNSFGASAWATAWAPPPPDCSFFNLAAASCSAKLIPPEALLLDWGGGGGGGGAPPPPDTGGGGGGHPEPIGGGAAFGGGGGLNVHFIIVLYRFLAVIYEGQKSNRLSLNIGAYVYFNFINKIHCRLILPSYWGKIWLPIIDVTSEDQNNVSSTDSDGR